ncbi:MAG TPA: hypothetical protein EYN00_02300 [Planctomycetes bacterium]|nr:hypothetical protein [Planctomycetota bacterium]
MTPTAYCRVLAAGLLGVVLFGASASAQKYGEVDKVAPSMKAPMGQTLEWTSAEGKSYWYRLPHKIDPRKPPNLVLMLHGTGLTWGWAFWNYPIARGGFRGNDIVIAPEGMTPGGGDTFNFIQGKRDGDHIAGLIGHFKSKFPIDKVYVYGHSQGAFFCYWFAGAYTQLVDGIVAHAGNVLSVNHNKLAKEKVAIGILHGKADAVVSVECAYRTEKIYKQQGYKKIKLTVVEGLNQRSGHWPLPRQVGEMFDWLDQVNADSPQLALKVALSELAKDSPDLKIVASSAYKAKSLARRVKGDEGKTLRETIEIVVEFLEEVQVAHASTIEEAKKAASSTKRGSFQPWMAHFRIVNASFKESKVWRKSLKSLVSKSLREEGAIDAALGVISNKLNKKTLGQAVAILQRSMLASNADELQRTFSRMADDPPAGTKEVDYLGFRQLTEKRTPLIEEGRATAAEITAEHAREFRQDNPELFAGE